MIGTESITSAYGVEFILPCPRLSAALDSVRSQEEKKAVLRRNAHDVHRCRPRLERSVVQSLSRPRGACTRSTQPGWHGGPERRRTQESLGGQRCRRHYGH